MRKYLFRGVLWGLLALAAAPVFGQDVCGHKRFRASLGFETMFDNREFKSEYAPSTTYFSWRLTPLAGFRFEGRHWLRIGGNVVRHMGATRKSEHPKSELILYYEHAGKHFQALAGVFQRESTTLVPREFISRTLSFYDPLIEGVMLRYKGRMGTLEAVGDWYRRKSETEREQFVLYSSGKLFLGRFSVGYHSMMQHFSRSANGGGVVDNGTLKPWVGFRSDLRHALKFNIETAWVQALQRDRGFDDKLLTPGGFWVDLGLQWRSLGVQNCLYVGDSLTPLWPRYGSELYMGDAFFRTSHGLYNRIDVYWAPYIGKHVSLKISTIHHYDGATWNWQQQALLRINFGK